MTGFELIASLVDSLTSLAWPISLVIIARWATRAYSGSFDDEDDET